MQEVFSILSFTQAEYAEYVFSKLGRGYQHACFLYSDWFRKGFVSSEAPWVETQARALVEEMISITDFSLPKLSQEKQEGSTTKFLLQFVDGLESESVIIPMKFGHTLCVSSQVGCKMGCTFCETGKMGIIRNLTVEEIIAQVYAARFISKVAVRNVVFMGMGEPFDNYESVMQAIKVLRCESGLSFAPSKITVSTSGVVDRIYRFMEDADPAVNLAVSLNAPNDGIRDKLMPVNRTWNMAELKRAMQEYCKNPRREILIGYVLMEGVNDSLEAAEELGAYLSGLSVKVNLIPYNPQSRDRFQPSSEATIQAFRDSLRSQGYVTLLRSTKGQSIMAACGQLGNKAVRKKLYETSRLSFI